MKYKEMHRFWEWLILVTSSCICEGLVMKPRALLIIGHDSTTELKLNSVNFVRWSYLRRAGHQQNFLESMPFKETKTNKNNNNNNKKHTQRQHLNLGWYSSGRWAGTWFSRAAALKPSLE